MTRQQHHIWQGQYMSTGTLAQKNLTVHSVIVPYRKNNLSAKNGPTLLKLQFIRDCRTVSAGNTIVTLH